jgi:hypothetical protein
MTKYGNDYKCEMYGIVLKNVLENNAVDLAIIPIVIENMTVKAFMRLFKPLGDC